MTASWRRQQAGYGFEDSPAFLGLDMDQGGAWLTQREINKVAGPAWLLSQNSIPNPLIDSNRCLIPPIPKDWRPRTRQDKLLP